MVGPPKKIIDSGVPLCLLLNKPKQKVSKRGPEPPMSSRATIAQDLRPTVGLLGPSNSRVHEILLHPLEAACLGSGHVALF